MASDTPEPIERLEEILLHPCDKTFNSLHDKGLSVKKELDEWRNELASLLEHNKTAETEIQSLRKMIAQKHEELMEILKTEEKISREIQKTQS